MSILDDDDFPLPQKASQSLEESAKPKIEPKLLSPSMFGQPSRIDRRFKKSVLWAPKCLPTHVPGFDEQLIFSSYENSKGIPGGLPLGCPGITVIGGPPGAGKSTLCCAIAALGLAYGEPVQFHTFEKPYWEVNYGVLRMVDAYNLSDKVKVERSGGEVSIENLEIVDEYHDEQKATTIGLVSRDIIEWVKETKGRLIILDSITAMTSGDALPERQLGVGLKRFHFNLATGLPTGHEIAILATSQHRGASRDAHLAGGFVIGHYSSAALSMESDFVDNFTKRYYMSPLGTLARSIKVIKTANHPHSHMEHFFNIGADGKCWVGQAIPSVSMNCEKCGERVDYERDAYVVVPKSGIAHLRCYEGQQNSVPKKK